MKILYEKYETTQWLIGKKRNIPMEYLNDINI